MGSCLSDHYPEEAKDFSRKLRKGAGADHSASGATRVAGTTNYKRKYEPDFPTVRIGAIAAARIVTKEQVEDGAGHSARTGNQYLFIHRQNIAQSNRPTIRDA